MTENVNGEPPAATLGLRHTLWVYTSPGAVFRRVDDSGGYGLALFALVTLITLIGYAEVQTGLIDRVVDGQTEARLADLEATQLELLDRLEFKEKMEGIRKQGEFEKLMKRIWAVVVAPVSMLASILLIASCLYAVVALSGRKPEYHTLVAICVYAAFIELARNALRLGMMLYYRTSEVNTSLGMLASSKEEAWLAAIDPFRIWYWVLAGIGVYVTRQLSRRMAIACCTMMCLFGMIARAGYAYVKMG